MDVPAGGIGGGNGAWVKEFRTVRPSSSSNTKRSGLDPVDEAADTVLCVSTGFDDPSGKKGTSQSGSKLSVTAGGTSMQQFLAASLLANRRGRKLSLLQVTSDLLMQEPKSGGNDRARRTEPGVGGIAMSIKVFRIMMSTPLASSGGNKGEIHILMLCIGVAIVGGFGPK